MAYYIVEVYTNIQGETHVSDVVICNTRQEADIQYYSKLAIAAQGANIKHSVCMMDEELRVVNRQSFNNISVVAEFLDDAGNVIAVDTVVNGSDSDTMEE